MRAQLLWSLIHTLVGFTCTQSSDPILSEHVGSHLHDEGKQQETLQSKEPVRGHLRPLGHHQSPEGDISVVNGFLDPETFYKQHVLPGKPVLFKGAAKDMPAFSLWHEDEYINKNYGSLLVEVEDNKKENRSGDLNLMTLSEFLVKYQEKDVYMVQDVFPEMRRDIGLPRPLFCGGFQNLLQVSVLWFSSGGTKSVLHHDDVDNINCILDGDKDIVFFDKAYKDLIEKDGFMHDGGYSQVDVERVDMDKFPSFQNLPWWRATMHKGDCLYIPIRWYHTVHSSESRNLAVNTWFHHLMWFNQTDCDEERQEVSPFPNFIPLAEYDLELAESTESMRVHMFEVFKGLDSITVEDAIKVWGDRLTELDIMELFQIVDTDKDMQISWREVYDVNVRDIIMEFPDLLPGVAEQMLEESQGHDEL